MSILPAVAAVISAVATTMPRLVEILADETDGKMLSTDFEAEKIIEMDVDELVKTDDV